jgi:hypothetical protein
LKVFLSWSGDISLSVAKTLRRWLPEIFPDIDPFISTELSAGTPWHLGVTRSLEESTIGILCLTTDNVRSPWLLFEAGALSTVIPFCFRIRPSELVGPLANLQAIQADKTGTRDLVQTINARRGAAKLFDQQLELIFDGWWPKFALELKESVYENADFRALFGPRRPLDEPGEPAPYAAVFTKAKLPPLYDDHNNPTEYGYLVFEYPPKGDDGHPIPAFPKGIGNLVPYEELAPVLQLDREFRKFGRKIELDLHRADYSELPKDGCLAMGLGFNNLTVRLGEEISKLYRVRHDEKTEALFGEEYERDYRIREKIQERNVLHDTIELCPNEAWHPVTNYVSDLEREQEWALLARVLSEKKEGADRVPYFVAAGHTAVGTAAAGYFLANHWRKLYQLCERKLDEHMVMIVTHPKTDPKKPKVGWGPIFKQPWK